MAHIYVDSHYTKYMNGQVELQIETATVRTALVYLFGTFPQLLVYLLENQQELAQVTVTLNGSLLTGINELELEVTEEDSIEVLCIIPSGEIPAWVIPVISIVLSVLSFAAKIVMAAIADNIAEPTTNSGNLDNSATYTFNGISNTTASGTSLQIAYGKVRTGGHVVSLFTRNGATLATFDKYSAEASYNTLYYQLALCEGEIQSISDVQIAKYPEHFYNAVETYPGTPDFLRVGTQAQSIMPDFSVVTNTLSVGRTVLVADAIIPLAGTDQTYTMQQGYIGGSHYEGLNFVPGPFKLTYYDEVYQNG